MVGIGCSDGLLMAKMKEQMVKEGNTGRKTTAVSATAQQQDCKVTDSSFWCVALNCALLFNERDSNPAPTDIWNLFNTSAKGNVDVQRESWLPFIFA